MQALSDIPPQVARRAVEWLIELQSGTATESMHREWQDWLHQHDDHAKAWRHIETVNAALQGKCTSANSVLAHATLSAPRSPKRRQAVKVLTALFFAGGTALLVREQAPWREWMADVRTSVGERRQLTLQDGTLLALNTDTAVSIRYTESERRIELVRGEIMVTTARDKYARPFIVEASQAQLQPLGTRFTVWQKGASSRLAVFEGAVRVVTRDAASPRVVHSGEQVDFTQTAIDAAVPANELDAAWSDGMIVASGMRLADFLTELSRHRRGRIGCDPDIADLRVSGTYPLVDTDRVLDALRTSLPVRVEFITRYWVTLRSAESA